MLNRIPLFLLLLLPSMIAGQQFELIHQFRIDSFERAELEYEGLYFVILGNLKQGVYTRPLISNTDGTNIRPSAIDGVFPKQFSNKTQIQARKNDKYGFVNPSGEVIIPIEYDYLGSEFVAGKILGKKDGQWFFIDTLNQVTLLPNTSNYEKLDIVNPTTIIGVNDRRESLFLDFEAKPLSDKKYKYIKSNPYHDHLFTVYIGKMRGVISLETGMVVPLELDINPIITKDYIWNEHLRKSESYFWDIHGKAIDTKHKTILKPAGKLGYIFKETRKDATRYGICDQEFKTLFPAKFDKVYTLPYGFIQLFYPKDTSIVVNSSGEIIVPKNRFKAHPFSPDDLVIKKTKWVNRKRQTEISWLDGNGETMIAPPIDATMKPSPFHGKQLSDQAHQILGVKQIDTLGISKFHLYDRNGQLLHIVKDDSVYYFTPSLIVVIKNQLKGLINKEGKLVLPIAYKHIGPFHNQGPQAGTIAPYIKLVSPDGRMGLADFEGKLLFLSDEKVDQIHWVDEKYIWVLKGNTYQIFEEKN